MRLDKIDIDPSLDLPFYTGMYTHTRPNFPYSWDDRANVYYNSKKIYILFKINIFPKFYAETLNTSREVFVINLGFNFQFKVMITIVAN